MSLTIDSTITLNNGVEMPRFGYGTYKLTEGAENGIRWALEAGYRAVDTASLYGNEVDVGKVIRAGIRPRDELFITSKAWTNELSYNGAHTAFNASLERLGLDVLDLYLIHWPVNDWQGAWKAFEELYESGRARAIGVSNFMPHHIKELLTFAKFKPVVNQIELHPALQQRAVQDYCRTHEIIITAWRPIMKGRVLEMPELVAIGEKYGKSAVQVTLRWLLQVDIIAIPKSATQKHIISNAELFDFELSAEDIQIIEGLDRDERLGLHPDRFPHG